MANTTAIEWTDLSWNPVHGCSKVSPGCAHCYAETSSLRYKQTTKPWTPGNAAENVLLKPHKLREPLSNSKDWRGLGDAARAAGKTEGKLVFVNSTSDLFHEQVPDEFIARVFAVMAAAPQHSFQVLTKRPERMAALLGDGLFAAMAADALINEFGSSPTAPSYAAWPLPNVWAGVSIENRRFVHRADVLRETPAAIRFISAEPLLGPLVQEGHFCSHCDGWPPEQVCPDCGYGGASLDLTGIDWLIVGGESGAGHRPMHEEWVRDLRDACLEEGLRRDPNGLANAGPAFFFKQWGGHTPKAGGRELDGRTWDEMPRCDAGVFTGGSGSA